MIPPARHAAGRAPAFVVFLLLLGYLLLRAPSAEFFLESLDHGYQLAVGQMVLSGRLQGADFFTLYGPLVGIISAAGLLIPGRPAGDVVICAIGYALCGTLVFRMLARRAGAGWALVATIAMLALLPRYYKWYYWLMPLAGLALSARYLEHDPREGRPFPGAVLWGLVSGAALLVRLDLGVHAAVYALSCVFVLRVGGGIDSRSLRRPGLGFLAGFAALPVLYGVLIAARSGRPLAFVDLLASLAMATQGVVTHWNQALPSLGEVSWMTVNGGTWILYGTVVAGYGFAALVALLLLRGGRGEDRREALVLLAFTIGGIGVFPQALSRQGLQHFLQAVAPFLLVLPLAVQLSWRVAGTRSRAVPALVRSASVALLTALAAGTVLVQSATGYDLGPVSRDHREAWYRLTHLPESLPDHPVTKTVAALRRLTAPDERIFLAMHFFHSPLVVFSERQVAGLQPVYMPGILTTPAWLQRNVRLLDDHPVRVLVVSTTEWAASPAEALAPYDAATVTRWRQVYDRVLFSDPRFEIRESPTAKRTSLNGSSESLCTSWHGTSSRLCPAGGLENLMGDRK